MRLINGALFQLTLSCKTKSHTYTVQVEKKKPAKAQYTCQLPPGYVKVYILNYAYLHSILDLVSSHLVTILFNLKSRLCWFLRQKSLFSTKCQDWTVSLQAGLPEITKFYPHSGRSIRRRRRRRHVHNGTVSCP